MEIQPIIVGTAGHIDHGKSTLVKTLTGIDPDRLKEEQERGMTIDLGFARFTLPDGRRVGMVDVPGHERFIKNMVAGATGIDLVVLVVAADDGVMPQTREHLAIMQILGVKRGLVALTKIDMVDPELVSMAAEDVRSVLAGTFLETAPILPLSSHTGEGLPEFKAELYRAAAATEPRSDAGIFRLPVQRVFSAKGFGTVVTGIPISGAVKVGEMVEVLPAGKIVKVRSIQAYQEASERARAGHSAAFNLADVTLEEVRRGDVVATPGFFKPVRMVAAAFEALPSLERALHDRLQVRLHVGTAEVVGELVLLDQDVVEPGAKALVQLRLEEPVVCAPGDRFVLRLASPALTLGGGVILEESRHRLKRNKAFVLDELARAEEGLGSPREMLEVELSRAKVARTVEELAVVIKRAKGETERLLSDLKSQKRAVPLGALGWIHAERLAEARQKVTDELARWFEHETHRQVIDLRDLRRLTGFAPEFLDALLALDAADKKLALEPGGLVRPVGVGGNVDPALEADAELVRAALGKEPFQPPILPDLEKALALPAKRLKAALELLVDRGAVVRINSEIMLLKVHHETARAAIIENCQKHGPLDIPSLRDKLATSRKYLIPLLEHFDAAGVTIRQGATRVLRKR